MTDDGVVSVVRRSWAWATSIRTRLTLLYVLLLAVVLLGFSGFVYWSLSRNVRLATDRLLLVEAQSLSSALEVDDGVLSLNLGGEEIPPGIVVTLFDRDGKRVVESTNPSLVLAPTSVTRAVQGEQTYTTVEAPDGTVWRVLTLPLRQDGERVAVLQVARDERDLHAALRRLERLFVVAIPVTLVIAVALGQFLGWRALSPVDRLTRAAAQIGAENLSVRLPVQSRDEVGRLAATFNEMLDRLAAAFARERRFTANAAHELRTPLTLLIASADVTLERPRSAEEYRQVIAAIREDAARLGHLVDDLLVLARADAGTLQLAREPVDVARLISETHQRLLPLARARGVTLGMGRLESVLVRGDRVWLARLLANLVENGLTYTLPGGSVTISMASGQSAVLIDVADTGPGIAPEHLPHIFEPFYRIDPSRSRDSGGSGLGLTIARWIARAHGGDVQVNSTPGIGSVFTVRLPIWRGE